MTTTADLKLYLAAAVANLMTTDLNSLANGSGILGTTVAPDNSSALNPFMEAILTVTFGSAPTANSFIFLYLIPSFDGTNYATTVDGASPFAPANCLAGVFELQAVTTLQRCAIIPLGGQGKVEMPPHLLKPYLLNKSGQALPASGTTVQWAPYRYQMIS